jgi:hypothetical protein
MVNGMGGKTSDRTPSDIDIETRIPPRRENEAIGHDIPDIPLHHTNGSIASCTADQDTRPHWPYLFGNWGAYGCSLANRNLVDREILRYGAGWEDRRNEAAGKACVIWSCRVEWDVHGGCVRPHGGVDALGA